MDHLSTPRNVKHPPIEIPYLCGDGFECLKMATQWQEGMERLDWPRNTTTAMHIQEWFYFGMLFEFFSAGDVDLVEKDFVRQKDLGRNVITTARLFDYLDRWVRNFKQFSEDKRDNCSQKVEKCLSFVQLESSNICSGKNDGNQTYKEVGLSVLILGSTLTFSRHSAFLEARPPNWKSHLDYTSWGPSELLFQRLLDTGWCPREIRSMSTSRGISTPSLYYFTLLDLPRDPKTHALCSNKTCSILQIDELNYQTVHRYNCAKTDCKNLGPCVNRISYILRTGNLPLIRIGIPRDFDDRLQLEVIESSPEIKYVAISHVWADGLGNVEDNSLPQCQVEYFQSLLREMYPKDHLAAIWIDTLCVPTTKHAANFHCDKGERNPRSLAIGKLADTYKKADKVLVLDRELQQYRYTSSTEMATRIVVCRWMQRLWTFQEAYLANGFSALSFQFLDKIASLAEIASGKLGSGTIIYESLRVDVLQHLLALNRSLPLQTSIYQHDYERIGYIWNELQWRSTSKQEDETICIAHLLGQPVVDLLEAPDEERMKILINMNSRFPTQILFMPGPRIAEDGYRWAPNSFTDRQRWIKEIDDDDSLNVLNESSHTLDPKTGPSHRTDKGLKVELPGMLLGPQDCLYDTFCLVDIAEKFCWKAGFLPDREPISDQSSTQESEHFAIIADRDMNRDCMGLAVLVSHFPQERISIYAKFECRMWLGERENYADLRKESPNIFEYKFKRHDKWCID